jgi:hypothetical protein
MHVLRAPSILVALRCVEFDGREGRGDRRRRCPLLVPFIFNNNLEKFWSLTWREIEIGGWGGAAVLVIVIGW